MGKWNPDVSFVELINIHKLVKTFEDWDMEELDDYENLEEGYVKEEYDNLKGIDIERNESFTELHLNLLKFHDIKADLNLSDYIIYLIILATNIKMKFFSEANSYFTELIGISNSQVEKSLSKLLKSELIFYVDNQGYYWGSRRKRISTKKYEQEKNSVEGKKDLFFKCVNDKREFVVNFEALEEMEIKLNFDDDQKKAIRKEARDKKKKQIELNRKLVAALKFLETDDEFPIERKTLLENIQNNFKNENSEKSLFIKTTLKNRGLNVEQMKDYLINLKNILKNKKK